MFAVREQKKLNQNEPYKIYFMYRRWLSWWKRANSNPENGIKDGDLQGAIQKWRQPRGGEELTL